MGRSDFGIDPEVLNFWAHEIATARAAGVELGVVVGGGNFFRGAGLAATGMDRVTADQMGMLATVMNCLALQDALERGGLKVRVMSAIRVNQICEDYIRRRAIRHLEKGVFSFLLPGQGTPFLPRIPPRHSGPLKSVPKCSLRRLRWMAFIPVIRKAMHVRRVMRTFHLMNC